MKNRICVVLLLHGSLFCSVGPIGSHGNTIDPVYGIVAAASSELTASTHTHDLALDPQYLEKGHFNVDYSNRIFCFRYPTALGKNFIYSLSTQGGESNSLVSVEQRAVADEQGRFSESLIQEYSQSSEAELRIREFMRFIRANEEE